MIVTEALIRRGLATGRLTEKDAAALRTSRDFLLDVGPPYQGGSTVLPHHWYRYVFENAEHQEPEPTWVWA